MDARLSIVFSVFLLAGLSVPAYGEIADNVVINEVDINPPGNDAASVSEWVELYNPTDSDIDLGGWQIASTTVLKKTMTISEGTIIEPQQFLTYSYQSVWFTDSAESVELLDADGNVVDKTPTLTDIQNDFTSWQRIYDGYDTDNTNDWKFVVSTTGSSNGKLVESQNNNDGIVITVSSEKDSFLFGETVTISGNVSEQSFVEKPFFQPESILVNILGPNFEKNITLYPDYNLNYETTLNLHQALGVNEGTYDVSVTYAGSQATTQFSVGYEIIEQETKEDGSVRIITDKSQYIPGNVVTLTGHTSETIPFVGMKLIITDSNNNTVYTGTLYPTDGEFSTTFFITTVNPAIGDYVINAEYGDKTISASFEVVEDIKEDIPISLWTDQDAYGLGNQVNISGRLNYVWIDTMDIEIVHTKQSSLITSSGSDSGFKILDGIRVQGDGSFSYSFKIPQNELRLGDYRITVSKDIGSASKVIHVVPNPDDFVASFDPITLQLDKEHYSFGETMTVSGFIEDPYGNPSYVTGTPVNISISNKDGSALEIIGVPEGTKRVADGVAVAYEFTAVPETSGAYSTQIDIIKNIFVEGDYVLHAEYLEHSAAVSFSVNDPLALDEGPVISIDKEVYGLSEVVVLNGLTPPTGATAVDISVTKPDGSVTNYGASIDNQRFSWSWNTPAYEKTQTIQAGDARDLSNSNFGIYKIQVATDSYSEDLFFKVSPDPQNDSLSEIPLFVTTEKTLYKAGDDLRVVGNVIRYEQGDEGLNVPLRVTLQVLDDDFPFPQIHESFVYPDQGGSFSSYFELPATVFDEGTYTIKAAYSGSVSETTFGVVNDFTFGIDEPVSLLLSTDKSEYSPGDVVTVSGKPNKLIYLEKFDVSVIQKTDNEITCGSFYCGEHVGQITSIRPSPSGSFSHQFVIPDDPSAVGSYEITVDADFETKSIQFTVINTPEKESITTIIEKENRIAEKNISIQTETKDNDGLISPRVISGSLITPIRSDEPSVNLMVSSQSGVCIIGPDSDCLVSESTRKPGQIYEVVNVDDQNLKVRYSGSDVRLEKFSIIPESSSSFLSDTTWNVEVIKEDQISRFYYKITYKNVE